MTFYQLLNNYKQQINREEFLTKELFGASSSQTLEKLNKLIGDTITNPEWFEMKKIGQKEYTDKVLKEKYNEAEDEDNISDEDLIAEIQESKAKQAVALNYEYLLDDEEKFEAKVEEILEYIQLAQKDLVEEYLNLN